MHFAAIILSAALAAQTTAFPPSSGPGLTVEQAVASALRDNPAILAARRALDVSRGQRLQLESVPDPEIVFSREGLPLGRHGGEVSEINLGIQQSLEFPGKRPLRGKIGRYGEEIARLDLERLQVVLGAEVKKAYYRVLFRLRTIALLETNRTLLDRVLEAARMRYEAGNVPYLDVLRAGVEKVKARNDQIERRKDLAADKIRLNLLLGRQGNEQLDLLSVFSFAPLEKDLASVRSELMAASRTIRIETVRRDQAAAGLVLSRKNLLPDLSVGLYLPSVRTGAWGFELSLSLPFVWKNGRRGETIEAEARSEISSIAAAAVRTRVAAGIESAFAGLKAVEEQVRLFEEKLLDDVARQIEAGLADYRIGRLDSLGLIDLYRTAAEARAEYWRSLLLYEEARAELERSGEENGEMGESHED